MRSIRFFIFLTPLLLCMPFVINLDGLVWAEDTNPTVLKLRQAIRETPEDPDKHFQLAVVFFGKYYKSNNANDLNAFIAETREAIRLRPDHEEAHLLLYTGLSYKIIETGDPSILSEQKREWDELLSLNPTTLEKLPPYQLSAGIMYLNKAEKEGDDRLLERALHEFKEVVRMRPNKPYGHFFLARVYAKQRKMELSLFEYKTAAGLDPENPEIHEMLGNIYLEKVHSETDCYDTVAIHEGIKEFKEIIRLNHEYATAHSKLAWLYRHVGSYDLEVFEAKEALARSESSKTHELLADAFLWKGDFRKSLEHYDKALNLKPEDTKDIFLNMAWLYFLQDRFEDAIVMNKKYFEMEKSPSAYIVIRQHLALRQIGRNYEARNFLENQAKNFNGKEWERNLLQYHMGKLTETELMGKAKPKCERCEAFFYIGYQHLLSGDKEKAIKLFTNALNTEAFCYYEYIGARTRLEQFSAGAVPVPVEKGTSGN